MRIIFDLSSLHGDNLQSFQASKLRALIERREIVVCHTPILIEEILNGALSQRHAERWPEVLGWAMDLGPRLIFLNKLDIWREELVVGAGPHARHAYPTKPTRRYPSHGELVETLRSFAQSRDAEALLDETTRNQVAADRRKLANQRRLGQEIRESVAGRARAAGGAKWLRDVPFWKLRNKNPQLWGRELASFLGPVHEVRVRSLWSKNPTWSPFYTAYAESIDFWAYHVACLQDVPIDINAQLDFEQLCYLTWADMVVSNDRGFFKLVFDALWKPKGKRLMSSDEFLKLVKELS